MKALLFVLILTTGLVSCSKSEDQSQQINEQAFFRVEAVNEDGEVIYSDVAVLR
jgi:hypothetical protein